MDRSSFSSPAWYHAFTLAERIALLEPCSEADSAIDPDSPGISQRLLLWQKEPQFQEEGILDRRLAHDGIDQEKLTRILATPPDHISNGPIPIGWLEWLTAGFSQPATAYSSPPPGAEELYFLDLIQPLVDLACEQLFMGIEQILDQEADVPFEPQLIEDILLMSLPGPLLTRMSRTLVLELNIARLQGHLAGDTPADRFASFVNFIRQPEHAVAILADYPVLARQLVICLNQWVEANLEFLRRLCQDWQEIRRNFSSSQDPGQLIELTAGAGDTHRDGRSVMIAEFESGFKLVYKPKSLAVDRHFQDLLSWLNDAGFEPQFRTLGILDRGSYGWVEFISRQECTNLAQVTRFYQRLGAYLALFYAINGSDFHLENLIAMGEQPIPIDLETLFNPEFEPFDESEAASQAARAMLNSVLVVGMLPQRLWSQESYQGIDISGFGGQAGQLSPDRVPQPDALGTDQMRYVRQRMEMSAEANRPVLDGKEVSAVDYLPEIVTGFRTMYGLLLRHRGDLLAANGPIRAFGQDETRILLRPTRTYDQLLFESFHPDFLGDALRRDLLFDRLWLVVSNRPFMEKALPSEQYDLRQGDIPVFTTCPSSSTIWDAKGEAIEGIILEDGMSVTIKRLKSLSQTDCARQEWFIHSTIATLSPFEFGIHRPIATYQLKDSRDDYCPERLLAGARSAAAELVETAVHGQDDVTWLSLEDLGDGIWDLAPVGADLYGGLAGISLFLAYAGALLHEDAFTTLARKSLHGVLRHAQQFGSELPEIGAFLGWGGTLFTLTHLAALWQDQELLSQAKNLIPYIGSSIAEDQNFTIFDGSAGAIVALLNFFRVTSDSDALQAALSCGDHLVASSQNMAAGIGLATPRFGPRPLLGFAHGSAGIAAALFQLAEVAGIDRYRSAARQIIAYERSHFSYQNQGWPDLRHLSLAEEPDRYPAAWCHGAVGIGLARAQILNKTCSEQLQSELDAALTATTKHGFGHNHSLCHGDLGSLELLLTAWRVTGNKQIENQLTQIGSSVLNSIERDSWQCGGPPGVTLPGLMIGVAGIGYQLLRLAEPHRVPSILLLEQPPLTTSRL